MLEFPPPFFNRKIRIKMEKSLENKKSPQNFELSNLNIPSIYTIIITHNVPSQKDPVSNANRDKGSSRYTPETLRIKSQDNTTNIETSELCHESNTLLCGRRYLFVTVKTAENRKKNYPILKVFGLGSLENDSGPECANSCPESLFRGLTSPGINEYNFLAIKAYSLSTIITITHLIFVITIIDYMSLPNLPKLTNLDKSSSIYTFNRSEIHTKGKNESQKLHSENRARSNVRKFLFFLFVTMRIAGMIIAGMIIAGMIIADMIIAGMIIAGIKNKNELAVNTTTELYNLYPNTPKLINLDKSSLEYILELLKYLKGRSSLCTKDKALSNIEKLVFVTPKREEEMRKNPILQAFRPGFLIYALVLDESNDNPHTTSYSERHTGLRVNENIFREATNQANTPITKVFNHPKIEKQNFSSTLKHTKKTNLFDNISEPDIAPVAQWLALWSHKQKVVGSNPAGSSLLEPLKEKRKVYFRDKLTVFLFITLSITYPEKRQDPILKAFGPGRLQYDPMSEQTHIEPCPSRQTGPSVNEYISAKETMIITRVLELNITHTMTMINLKDTPKVYSKYTFQNESSSKSPYVYQEINCTANISTLFAAPIAQWLERKSRKQKVAGSAPVRCAFLKAFFEHDKAASSPPRDTVLELFFKIILWEMLLLANEITLIKIAYYRYEYNQYTHYYSTLYNYDTKVMTPPLPPKNKSEECHGWREN